MIKGVLKSEWIIRHYNIVPSVLVIVLDWPDINSFSASLSPTAVSSSPVNPLSTMSTLKGNEVIENWRQYGEKDLAKVLDTVLQASRKPRVPLEVIAVLIQKETTALSQQIATDFRLSTLFKFIEPKNCMSFNPDDAEGSIKKIERAILRRSVDYYADEINELKLAIKSGVDNDNYRFIARHYFKVAYLYEMANEAKKAIKHYGKAFALLTENKVQRDEIDEFKVVCEVINFKLCRWYLEKVEGDKALAQFHRFITHFRSLVQDSELISWHHAWVAKQYQVMGQLLEIYPLPVPLEQSLTASSSSKTSTPTKDAKAPDVLPPPVTPFPPRSPGYYFETAANSLIRRRVASEALVEEFKNDMVVKQLVPKVKPEISVALEPAISVYLGQKIHKTLLKATSETDDILQMNFSRLQAFAAQEMALLNPELNASFANRKKIADLAIELLLKAREYHALENQGESAPASVRRALSIVDSTLAAEFLATKQFAEALTEADKHISMYISEQWWSVVEYLANIGLVSAKALGDRVAILRHALTLSLPELSLSKENRAEIFQLFVTEGETASQAVVLHQPYRPSPLQLQLEFMEDTASPGSAIPIRLHVFSHFPRSLQVKDITLSLQLVNDSEETSLHQLSLSKSIEILPVKKMSFDFTAQRPDSGVLKCISIDVLLYDFVSMEWKPFEEWDLSSKRSPKDIHERTSISVVSSVAKLGVSTSQSLPVYIGELFPINIRFENFTDKDISKISVGFSLSTSSDEVGEKDEVFFRNESSALINTNEASIKDLGAKEDAEQRVLVRVKQMNELGVKTLTLKTTFTLNGRQQVISKEIPLRLQHPFVLSSNVFNSSNVGMLLWNASSVRDSKTAPSTGNESPLVLQSGESLDAALILTAKSSKIRVSNVGLQMNLGADNLPIASVASPPLPAEGFDLDKNTTWTHWFRIKPLNPGLIHLGVFTFNWKRASSEHGFDFQENTSTLILPIVDVMHRDFGARIVTPDVAFVGAPMRTTFVVSNRSAFPTSFHIKVSDNTFFLMAGDKFSTFSVNPNSDYELQYSLVPLLSGRLQLPKFTLSTAGGGAAAANSQNWMVSPSHSVFVKPEQARAKLI